MQTTSIWGFREYTTRSSQVKDRDVHYLAGLTECDSEVACMTGSKMHYGKEEADAYFVNCLNDSTRYDFLILGPQSSLIDESIINEVDEQAHSTDLRICIFKSKNCGKGIDSRAIQTTRDFVSCERKLHRLSPDVFSFNIWAKEAYEKVGFHVEGIPWGAIWDNGTYAGGILMSMLEEEWRQIT